MKRSALTSKTLKLSLLIFLLLPALCPPVFADPYSQNLKYGLKRGAVNIVTSPLEIPIGIQDYHERSGWPLVRQTGGLIAGTGKMVLRLGSGVVDLVTAWVPGLQKGLPPRPEFLF